MRLLSPSGPFRYAVRAFLGLSLCILSAFFSASSFAAPAINRSLNYQARLLDSSGSNVPDGVYQIEFSIYSQSSGGTPIWTASGTNSVPTPLNITVQSGLFTVLLGDTSFQSQNAFDFDWYNDSLYVGVTVGADSEMSPRKRLSSVPYAFVAESLQGQFASSTVTSTGGTLFALNQNSANAASAARSVLSLTTQGTSNLNDYLITGANSGATVFTVSRQGNVTTTGNLSVAGNTTLINATATNLFVTNSVMGSARVTGANSFGNFLGIPTVFETSIPDSSYWNLVMTNETADGGYAFQVFNDNALVLYNTSSSGAEVLTFIPNTPQALAQSGFANSPGLFIGPYSTTTPFGSVAPSIPGTDLGMAAFSWDDIYASGTAYIAQDVVVGGQSVCLESGVNCPAAAASLSIFTENATDNTVFLTTSTRDVLLGGSTTATAGFLFDSQTTPGTSTLFVGGSTNTNLLVGTSTYGGGLGAQFSLSGNDILAQGQVGSIGGLFSATGVTVGASSTIYGDGFIYKNNGAFSLTSASGDLTLQTLTSGGIVLDPVIGGAGTTTFGGSSLDNVAFTARVGTDILPAVDNFYSLGSATNRWAGIYANNVTSTNISTTNLTVLNGITVSTTSPTIITTMRNNAVLDRPTDSGVAISGKYAYVPSRSGGQGRIAVIDISNPGSATSVGSSLAEFISGFSYNSVVVGGKYLYVGGSNGVILVHDISSPANPVRMNQPAQSNYFSPASIQTMHDLALSGKYLYAVGSTPGTFNIIDAASSTRLQVVSTYTSSTVFSTARGVSVQNGFAYVVSDGQLTVLDVATSTTTTVRGIYRDATNLATARYTAISGKRLYVAAANRLTIIDISNPATPTLLGAYVDATNLAGASRVAVAGNTVYVTAPTNNKVVGINVSNPAAPYVTGILTDSTNMVAPYGIAISGMHAYVANGSSAADSAFNVLSLSGFEMGGLNVGSVNAGSIYTSEHLDVGGMLNVRNGLVVNGGGILSNGELAVMGLATSTIQGRLHLFNGTQIDGGSIIHNMSNQMFDNDTVVSSSIAYYHTEVVGRYLYATHQNNSFSVHELSTTSTPSLISTISNSTALDSARDFAISGNYAYVLSVAGSNPQRLTVLDISNPATTTIVYTTSTGYLNASTIKIKGSYAYVVHSQTAGNPNITIWDISSSTNPAVVRTITNQAIFGQSTMSAEISGNYLYVGGNSAARFTIVDITNPLAATATGMLSLSVGQNGITVRGKYAYVSSGSNFNVVDVSSSTNPTLFNTFGLSSNSQAVTIAGNYVFLATTGGGVPARGVGAIDISNPGAPRLAGQRSTIPEVDLTHLTIVGRKLYGTSATGLHVITLNGVDVAVANIGNLSGDSAFFSRNLTVSGQADFFGGLVLGGDLMGTQLLMRGTGTSTFLGAVSTTRLLVNGKQVCLADGTNCPASGSSEINWTFDGTSNFIRPATSTNDVVIGATASASAPFYFDVNSPTSSLQIGRTGNASLFVGTSTYGGGLNSLFTMNGDDAFIQGNLGVASSVYTNGAFIAGSGSTFFGDGFIQKTNGSLTVSSTANVILNPSGNVLVGTSTGSEKLTVVGGISNRLASSTLEAISTFAAGDGPIDIEIQGDYGYYVTNQTPRFRVVDLRDPSAMDLVGDIALSGNPNGVAIQGRYAYTANGTVNTVSVVDITNPVAPFIVTSFSVGSSPGDLKVSGNYLYVLGTTGDEFRIYDISIASAPRLLRTLSTNANPRFLDVKGKYAYISNTDAGSLQVVDISNPTTASIVSTLGGIGQGGSLEVQGRYAFRGGNTSNTFQVIDVSNPTAPALVATTTLANAWKVHVEGYYAYVTQAGTPGGLAVVDISSSTRPIVVSVQATATGSNYKIAVKGKALYQVSLGGDIITAYKLPGTETSALLAHSAEIGSLRVMSDASIDKYLRVTGGVSIGYGGLNSAGALLVSSTNTTSTITFAVSSTIGEFSNRLTVGGVAVCLANGTNCPTGATSDVNWTYNNAGEYVAPSTSTVNVVVGASGNSQTVGNLGVGTSTPSEKFTLVGNMANTLVQGQSFTDVASTTLPNMVNPAGLILDGRYAYVAQQGSGTPLRFHVVDVSFPAVPSSVGSVLLSDASSAANTFSMARYGRYVYVPGSTSGTIYIVDISDPSSPTSVAGIPFTSVHSVVISGKYLFAGESTNIRIYDLTNPLSPTLVQTIVSAFPGSGGGAMHVNGNYLVLGDVSIGTFRIYDITDPTTPELLVNTSGPGGGVVSAKIQGSKLYLGASGFHIYDISNPRSPILNASVAGASVLNAFDVQGRYAYVTQGTGYRVIDVASSTNPITMFTTSTYGSQARDLVVAGRYLYHTHAATDGLVISLIPGIETTGLIAHSAEVGSLSVRTDAEILNRLFVGGQINVGAGGITSDGALAIHSTNTTSTFAFAVSSTRLTVSDSVVVGGTSIFGGNVAMGTSTVSALDKLSVVGNIRNTLVVGQTFTDTASTTLPNLVDPAGLIVEGRYAYVAQQGTGVPLRLHVLDLSEQTSPSSVGSVLLADSSSPVNTFSMARYGKYLYVPGFSSGTIYIVDTSDPSAPTTSGSFTFANAHSVVVSGKYLFAGESTNMQIYDLTNPLVPRLIRTVVSAFPGSGGGAMHVNGNYLVLGDVSIGTFRIYDITDPTNPELLSNQTGFGGGVVAAKIQGNYLYLGASGLGIYDIANPRSPALKDSFSGVSVANGLWVNGRYAYLSGTNGYVVLDVASSTDIITIRAVTGFGGQARDLVQSGRYLYHTHQGTDSLVITDIAGIETNGLIAASVEAGFLQVRTDATIGNRLAVGGVLSVGSGGISSLGSLSIHSTNTTSTFAYAVSTTRLRVDGDINVGGSGNFGGSMTFGGDLGVGTSTPSEKFTLVGNMANTLVQGQSFTDVASTTLPNMVDPAGLILDGRYAYVAQQGSGTPLRFHVVDVSFPAVPSSVGSVLLSDASSAANTFSMARYGRYVYVPGQSSGTIYIVDISDPSAPTSVGGIAQTNVLSVVISGKYLYAGDTTNMRIYDVTNPLSPTLVRTIASFAGGSGGAMHVNGNLLVAGDVGTGVFRIYDITDPTNPELLSANAGPGGGVVAAKIQGRYLYLGSTNFHIYDISNPRSPILNASVSGVSVTNALDVQGRYAFVTQTNGYRVIDVASSTNPITMFTTSTHGSQARDLVVAGRYLYHTHAATDSLIISLIPGIETTGIIAHSAEVGSLQVRTDADILNKLFVGGQINVGAGGITSDGALAIHSTNTTSTFAFAVSSTRLTVSDATVIGGTAIISGNVAMGTSTISTLDKLSVVGNIRNTLVPNQTFTDTVSTTLPNLVDPAGLTIEGRYAYVAQQGSGTPLRFHVIDVSEQTSPSSVGSVLLSDSSGASNLFSMARYGKYMYVPGATSGTVYAVDTSDPSSPVSTSVITFASVHSVVISGKYLYAGDTSNLRIYDLTNPLSPILIRTVSVFAGGGGGGLHVSGNYLVAGDVNLGSFRIYDITDPTNPELLSNQTGFGGGVVAAKIQGNYLYLGASGLGIYDIANPRSPALKDSFSGVSVANGLWVNGRYAYLSGTNGYVVLDVASSTDIITIRAVTGFGGQARDLVQSGRYLYHTHQGTDSLVITDIAGIETNGLIAASVEAGFLQVRTDATVGNRLSVGGAFSVGIGGISSQGALSVHSTNTTSTFAYAVSSSVMEVSNRLTVGGFSVCLANGTNCPADAPAIFTENATDNTVFLTTSTRDVLLGGNTTATAGFLFDSQTTPGTSTLFVGGSTNTNLLVGTSTYGGGLGAAFSLSGNDILAQGQIGSVGGMFSATGVTVGTSSTVYGDGFIYKNNGAFSLTSVAGDVTLQTLTSGGIVLDPIVGGSGTTTIGGSSLDNVAFTARVGTDILPSVDNLYNLGSATNRWFGLRANNVTSTFIETDRLLVNQSITVSTTAPSIVRTVRNSAVINSPGGAGNGDVVPNIVVSGKYAYVPSSGRLGIVDISNPANATTVGSVNIVGAGAVGIYGNYAIVTRDNGGSNGISWVDISNPAAPTALAAINTYGSEVNDIQIVGKFAYMSSSNATTKFVTMDLSATPTVVGRYTSSTFGTSRGVRVQGKYAYMATDDAFVVLDISNAATPTQVGALFDSTNLNNATYMEIQGRYAYVSANSQFTILDISNPTAPTTVGSLVAGGVLSSPARVAISGNIVYLTSGGTDSVVAIDVSNPTSPFIIGVLTDSTNMNVPTGIAISGRHAFVTNGSTGADSAFHVLAINGYEMVGATIGSLNVSNIQTGQNIDVGGALNVRGGITSDGGGIFTSGELSVNGSGTSTFAGKIVGNGGLEVTGGDFQHFPQSFGSSTQVASTTNNYSYSMGRGKYLYATDDDANAFVVFDVTNSTVSPVAIGQITSATLLATPDQFDITGDYAYIAAGSRLTVVSIASPTAPTIVTSTGSSISNASHIKIRGQYAYVAQQPGVGLPNVLIFDISNPQEPVLVRTISDGGGGIDTDPQALDISGNYLFVGGDTTGRFSVIDISNPLTATTTGSVVTGAVASHGLVAQGSYVRVVAETDSLKTVNVVNPTAPTVGTCASLSGNIGPIAIAGDYAYVGVGTTLNGIEVFDISSTSTCVSMGTKRVSTTSLNSLSLHGKTLYASAVLGLHALPLHGIEASVAQIGSLNGSSIFLTHDLTVYGMAHLLNGINASADILTAGTIHARGIATSTLFSVSTTRLTVNGQQVCLANGTNCPASSGDSNWTFDGASNFIRPATSTNDVVIGATASATAPFYFDVESPTSSLQIGRNGNANLFVGTSTYGGGLNTLFSVNGDDAFIQGSFGVASSIFSNADAYVAGRVSSTRIVVGYGSASNLAIAFGEPTLLTGFFYASNNGIQARVGDVPSMDFADDHVTLYQNLLAPSGSSNTYDLGGVAQEFKDVYASGTAYIGTDVLVAGRSVCLEDGTNCPASGSGDSNWTFDGASNFIRPATSTNDVVIGATASATAPFYFDVNSPTSSLQIGRNGNANLFVGTSTYGGGLHSFFSVNGDDAYIQGSLGVATSVFTNGNVRAQQFIATTGTAEAPGFTFGDSGGGDGIYMNGPTQLVIAANGAGRLFIDSGEVTTSLPLRPLLNGITDLGLPTAQWRNGYFAGNVSSTMLTFTHATGSNIFTEGNTLRTAATINATGVDVPYAVLQGRYLYVMDATNDQLKIYDVSSPSTPSGAIGQVSVVSSGDSANLVVQDGYAYLVDTSVPTFKVIDVRNPRSPVVVGSYDSLAGRRIAIQGKYAYVTDSDGFVEILDISRPNAPRTVSTVTLAAGAGSLNEIAVQGRYAYVVDSTAERMHILDIQDPVHATFTGFVQFNTGADPFDVAVQGRYAYVTNSAGGNGTLNIVDISNPTAPVNVGTSTAAGGAPFHVNVSGRYALVSDFVSSTVYLIDVASSTSPRTVASTTVAGGPAAISVNGRYAAVGNRTNGIVTILEQTGIETQSLIAHSAEIGGLQVEGDAFMQNRLTIGGSLGVGSGGIWSAGALAIAATNTTSTIGGSLSVLNIFENTIGASSTIQYATTTGPTDPGKYVAVRDGYAYNVSEGNDSFQIYNVMDPMSPVLMSSTTIAGISSIFDAELQGKYLYLQLATANALHVYDVSSSTNPILVSTMSTTIATDLTIAGRYLYLGASNSLRVYDISNPYAITQVESVSYTGGAIAQDMEARGNRLYFATSSGFVVYDISNPFELVTLGTSTGFTSVRDIEVQGAYAYVNDIGTDLLTVMDVSDVTNAVSVATIPFTNGESIAVSGRYLFLGVSSRLSVYDVSTPASPLFVTASGLGAADSMVVDGRHVYAASAGSFIVHTLPGAELGPANISSAKIGTASILHDLWVGDEVEIGNELTVGAGGIYSFGGLASNGAISAMVSSTGVTPAFFFNGTSNTVPVLDVRGGCNNNTSSTSAGLLIRAGNMTDTQKFRVGCNGTVAIDGTFNTGGADFAEYFYTTDTTLGTGEVVVLNAGTSTISRAESASRNATLGVISSNPGFIGNATPEKESNPESWKVVALMGQVRMKADASSDAIVAGDLLMTGPSGRAVKARGVGQVIGRALSGLASGVGEVDAMISPEWSAENVLAADGSALLVSERMTLDSLFTASSVSTTADSESLELRGSFWNGSSAQISSFTLVNDIVDASTSLFSVRGPADTNLLTISNLGDASISGDLTVGRRLYLGSKANGVGSTSTYIFVDDTLSPTSTYIATNADGWSTSSTYDYAERFASSEELVPGDLVVADPTGIDRVKRTTGKYDVVLGIVSTKPGFVTGAPNPGTFPIALAGRVPTRVSTANGTIEAGDQLAPSDVPGVAIKATGAGQVIGIALEGYANAEEGKISVFVQPGWKGDELITEGPSAGNVTVVSSNNTSPRQGLAKIYAGATEVEVTFETLNAYPLITATPYGLPVGGWGLRDVTDRGFTLVLSETQTFDLTFSWTAEPSQAGNAMSFSDGTASSYDPTSGQIFGPELPPLEEPVAPSTTTSTPPVEPAQSTSTEPLPEMGSSTEFGGG